ALGIPFHPAFLTLRTVMFPFPVNQFLFPAFIVHEVHHISPTVTFLPCSTIVTCCHVFVFVDFFYHYYPPFSTFFFSKILLSVDFILTAHCLQNTRSISL